MGLPERVLDGEGLQNRDDRRDPGEAAQKDERMLGLDVRREVAFGSGHLDLFAHTQRREFRELPFGARDDRHAQERFARTLRNHIGPEGFPGARFDQDVLSGLILGQGAFDGRERERRSVAAFLTPRRALHESGALLFTHGSLLPEVAVRGSHGRIVSAPDGPPERKGRERRLP